MKSETEPRKYAYLCFAIPLVIALAGSAILLVVGYRGWPGTIGVEATGFCEELSPGPVKQPTNTWSNVSFIFVGLLIGFGAWRDLLRKKSPDWTNRMVTTLIYPTTYACSAVLIGLGSASLHASTTRWGSELDLFAMHLWAGWCIAYARMRMLNRDDIEFFKAAGAMLAALLLRIWLEDRPRLISGSNLFALMIAAGIGIEVVGQWRNRHKRRTDGAMLMWAILIFLVAYATWKVSQTDQFLCSPGSMWQGHAAWHVLCSGSVWMIYQYGRSERELT